MVGLFLFGRWWVTGGELGGSGESGVGFCFEGVEVGGVKEIIVEWVGGRGHGAV